jgi:hypothetical protein
MRADQKASFERVAAAGEQAIAQDAARGNYCALSISWTMLLRVEY